MNRSLFSLIASFAPSVVLLFILAFGGCGGEAEKTKSSPGESGSPYTKDPDAVDQPIVFDFEDPKKVNNLIFQMDAPLEAINGSAMGISGKVTYNPADPAATQGSIHLATATLHLGNPTMKEHLHGADWMNVAKYPEIKFTLYKLTNLRKDGLHLIADAHGSMTIKGVTKPLLTSVKLTYLKDMLIKRNRVPGDLLVIRSKFVVERSDFGIQPGEMEEKVSDQIEISLNLAGAAPSGE
ncbi:MAG: YceI family protein [Opitutales bacterium]